MATRRAGQDPRGRPGTLRDASGRATKAFYPALSMCDLIFSGVFERHPRLTLAIVEFELSWAPHLLSAMDYTYRERHGEAIYRFKSLPSRRRGRHAAERLLPRNVVLSLQEDAIGIRLRDVIGLDNKMWDNMIWDNMMWGSDYPHSESTFPQCARRRRSWAGCRTTNRPSLPRTTIRGSPGSPPATPPACTILTWRG